MTMPNHKYRVGQTVAFTGRSGTKVAVGECEIVRLLPSEEGQCLYRIKSVLERWERVAAEDQLVTSSGARSAAQ